MTTWQNFQHLLVPLLKGCIILCIGFFCVLLASTGKAQQYNDGESDRQSALKRQNIDTGRIGNYNPAPNNIIKTSPTSLFISQNLLTGEFRVGYEFAPRPKLATFVSASIHYPNPIGLIWLDEAEDTINTVLQNNFNAPQDIQLQMLGYRFQIGQKFYLLQSPKIEAPEGLYIGPMVSFGETHIFPKGPLDWLSKLTYLSANLMIGYQFLIGDNFALDLTTGLRYRHNYWNDNGTDKKMDRTIEGPFGNKQKGFFYMNQIHFGVGFDF